MHCTRGGKVVTNGKPKGIGRETDGAVTKWRGGTKRRK